MEQSALEHMTVKKPRQLGPDLIRCVAICLVFITHAVVYTGVMFRDSVSLPYVCGAYLHYVAISCVPIFLILSGYLCLQKKLSLRYYGGLVPILLSYVVISVLSAIALNLIGCQALSVGQIIRGIFDFSDSPYGWYVEMYIGLFLLIPFINRLWNTLGKKSRNILLLSMMVITFVPQIGQSIIVNGAPLNCFPDYWEITYPVTYYLIGAWIRTEQPVIRKRVKIPLLILSTLIAGTLNCLALYRTGASAGYMLNGFHAPTTAFVATMIFLCLYRIEGNCRVVSAVTSFVSKASFEMYLCSAISDYFIVFWLFPKLAITERVFVRLPLLVAGTFVLSLLLATIIRLLLSPLSRLIRRLFEKETPPESAAVRQE